MRRQRAAELISPEAERIRGSFARELGGLTEIPLDGGLTVTAYVLLGRHPLRTLDSLQLASALRILESDPAMDLTFVAADERLLEAVKAEGLSA